MAAMNDRQQKRLFLLFRCGDDSYALDCANIVEVLPKIRLGPAGLLAYRGRTMPVADISFLLTGKPGTDMLSTRIVVVRKPGEGPAEIMAGIIAEHALETVKGTPSDAAPTGGPLPLRGTVTIPDRQIPVVDIPALVDNVVSACTAAPGKESA